MRLLAAISAALAAGAPNTPTVDLSRYGASLWFRQCPQGQGRNAKQRRAQRKARHSKRIRSYKR